MKTNAAVICGKISINTSTNKLMSMKKHLCTEKTTLVE